MKQGCETPSQQETSTEHRGGVVVRQEVNAGQGTERFWDAEEVALKRQS